MKRSLRIASVTLVLGAILTLAQVSASGEPTHVHTLNQALKAAMENNVELQLLEERLELAEARHQEVSEDVQYAKNRKSNDPQQEMAYRRQELVDPLTAETQLYELKYQRADKELEVRLQVESIFYQYTLAQEQYKSAANEIKAADSKYEKQKKLVAAGKAVAATLDSLELESLQLQQKAAQIESQMELLLLDLSSLTGIARNQLTALEAVHVPNTAYSIEDMAKLVVQVKDNHPSIKLAQKKVDIAAKEYEITQRAYHNDDELLDEMKAAEDNAFSARLALRDALVQAEVKVRSDYLLILNAMDDTGIAKLDQELSAKSLDIAEKRYSLGLITNTELEQARIQTQSAANALLQAKLNVCLALEKYKHYISSQV